MIQQVVLVKELKWSNGYSVCVHPNVNRSTAGSKLLNKWPIRPAVSWLDQNHTHTFVHESHSTVKRKTKGNSNMTP